MSKKNSMQGDELELEMNLDIQEDLFFLMNDALGGELLIKDFGVAPEEVAAQTVVHPSNGKTIKQDINENVTSMNLNGSMSKVDSDIYFEQDTPLPASQILSATDLQTQNRSQSLQHTTVLHDKCDTRSNLPGLTEVKAPSASPQAPTLSLDRTRNRRTTIANSSHGNGGRDPRPCNKWQELDDVFLSGFVMDMYYRRHSLKPTQLEKTTAQLNGEGRDMLVWQEIHKRFNTARDRYQELTGRKLTFRTTKSLQRHWKDTGEKRKLQFSENPEELPRTRLREMLWDEHYNYNQFLSCSDQKYQELLQSREKVEEYRGKQPPLNQY